MSPKRRRVSGRAGERPRGVFAVAGWLALLLAALSLVTWRQTRGVELEAALRALEMERGIAESERVAAARRIEELRSRSRVVAFARDRLGMHLPNEREIVFLPITDP
jgi:hypothetical protein